jgi:raw score 3.25
MEFEPKGILKIEGSFFVPDYQRGYRWGTSEVELLLNDITENGKQHRQNYYLQPIVVKAIGKNNYELIDGQQRLTTLYLILSYLRKQLPSARIRYDITYETRKETHDYLQNIDFSKKEDNIDFFFIANAFETIEGWFEKKQKNGEDLLGVCINFYQQLNDNVKIIWYEPDENVSGVELFTRLNIGRIPLTNSELVRALFLSRNCGLTNGRQLEIAAEWDNIEKELHSPAFWAFLTNYNPKEYPNRIELLFDMMAGGRKTKDKYATFFFFNQRINEQGNKIDVWNSIIAFYEQLKEWYESRELFHKVGYLVALNQESLRRLLNETKEMKKSEVSSYIDCKIKESLKDIESLENLNYHDNYQDIHNVLLLFNIISIMKNDDDSLRFPFDKYKANGVKWSLEHIHAQNAETLNTSEKRKEWLRLHYEVLPKGNSEDIKELESRITEALNLEVVSRELFTTLQRDVFSFFSEEENGEYIDNLSNMALLNCADNAALNNSVFEVKRQQIIEMDKKGHFIPYCTRMVFLKYYNSEINSQLHSWDENDREAYMAAISEVLSPYLTSITEE